MLEVRSADADEINHRLTRMNADDTQCHPESNEGSSIRRFFVGLRTTDRVRHLLPGSLSASSLLKLLVRLYQCTFGIVLPNSCRYQPTCSHYALAALTEHGAVRGTWLTLKRILRCHPFAGGGYDPAPLKHGVRSSEFQVSGSDALPGTTELGTKNMELLG